MAVLENIATEDGDILIIKTGVPVVGIVALSTFTDSTSNESESIYFEKTFRYSTNGGITFSDWLSLTVLNVQNIVIERVDYFIVEYRYKRIGSGEPNIAFNNATIGGTINPLEYPTFYNMIFGDLFTPNNIEVLGWAINVLEKLYKKGIIPSYISREEGGDDTDYISYWFSITHFFAILVYYARGFENISSSVVLMREFVKGRGVYMRNNADLEELYYIYSNYIQEIKRRGTKWIGLREGDILSGSSVIYYYGEVIGGDLIYAEEDGEILRLIDYADFDEFLFAFTTRGELGWCIGQSSPLYTGADNIKNLIKGYEFTSEIVDLEKYPLLGSDYLTLNDGKIRVTSVPPDHVSGIGYTGVTNPIKAFVVDPSLSYEISFKVKKSNSDEDLYFGVSFYDRNGILVQTINITNGANGNSFFADEKLNKTNTEYWIRGVVYPYNTPLMPNDKLNIGFGHSVRFQSNVCYMVPLIFVDNVSESISTDIVDIWDIKVRIADLGFSRGLMSARNFIIGFLRNRSNQFNNQKVEDIINSELIPYNTFTKLKFL
jgi:hypothetical protein